MREYSLNPVFDETSGQNRYCKQVFKIHIPLNNSVLLDV
jgi:hypothetical protein